MLNTTFASFKNHKEPHILISKNVKKGEGHPTTFKEIRELNEATHSKNTGIYSHKKALENQ